MGLRAAALLGLALTCASTAWAQSAPPAAERAELARVEALGQLLYAYDQAAWHGTDAALKAIPEPAKALGGYIVDGPATAPTLIFLDRDQASPRKVFVARYARGKLIDAVSLPKSGDRSLTPGQLRMVDARRRVFAALAIANDVRPCAKAMFNTVILPPATPEAPVPVYLLTPQTSNDSLPFGGHFRTEVSIDGRGAPFRHFTNSCLEMPKTSRDMPKGAKSTMLFVTHLRDPRPTELHVFTSLYLALPLGVGTTGSDGNTQVWSINRGRIAQPVAIAGDR